MTDRKGRTDAKERYAERRDVEGAPGAEDEGQYGNQPIPGTYGGSGTETEMPEAGTRAPPGSLPGESRLYAPPGKCPVCGGETEHVPTCKGCGDPVTRCKCR
jgi:hypothetical protein